MKKRVEAELISIAHRILKLKNKSEIDQLYKETQKLYEALTILKFHGDNYDLVKNSISSEEIEEKVTAFIEPKEELVDAETKSEIQPEVQEEVSLEEEVIIDENQEIAAEKIQEDPIVIGEIIIDEEDDDEEVMIEGSTEEEAFTPSFELSFDGEKANSEDEVVVEKTEPKITPSKQVTMNDVFGDHFREPIFVKPEDNVGDGFIKATDQPKLSTEEPAKTLSINDSLTNAISIGLNDRIGFVKHLFNNSNEDYNRVLSQLNTFNTFADAKTFLNEMVIPDYNYWVGKEEYLERFMEIVEQKFK